MFQVGVKPRPAESNDERLPIPSRWRPTSVTLDVVATAEWRLHLIWCPNTLLNSHPELNCYLGLQLGCKKNPVENIPKFTFAHHFSNIGQKLHNRKKRIPSLWRVLQILDEFLSVSQPWKDVGCWKWPLCRRQSDYTRANHKDKKMLLTMVWW